MEAIVEGREFVAAVIKPRELNELMDTSHMANSVTVNAVIPEDPGGVTVAIARKVTNFNEDLFREIVVRKVVVEIHEVVAMRGYEGEDGTV